MVTTIRYLMTCCRVRAYAVDYDNPQGNVACKICPIAHKVLKESDGWDMSLDDKGGIVTCQLGDGPVIHLPPGCYACAWEEEPV